MKLSKSHIAEEIKALQKAGLAQTSGKPRQPGLTPLDLLNARSDQKSWFFSCVAILEPWLLTQADKGPISSINPLLLYISKAQAGEHLSPHPLIDTEHLKEQLGSTHLKDGFSLLYSYLKLPETLKQQLSPSPWFEPSLYLKYNSDLTAEQRADPFVHYLLNGAVECRPASTRFDPNKWREGHRKPLHKAPITDFLLKRHQDPLLRPTRPNLPGEITGISADGEIRGWVQDPDATTIPQVNVWWEKLCIAKGRLQTTPQSLAKQFQNQVEFKAQLPAFLAEDLVNASNASNLRLFLQTHDGEEIGSPKGWQPNQSDHQQIHQWLKNLEASPTSSKESDDLLMHPDQHKLVTEIAQLSEYVRDHERRIRTRLGQKKIKFEL